MSMYRFVKDPSNSVGSKRLFLQGTTGNEEQRILGPPYISDITSTKEHYSNIEAVVTKKRLSCEVLGSSLESTRTSQQGEDGSRRITTTILRKVQTITRGEEDSRNEDLTRRANVKSIKNKAENVEDGFVTERYKKVKVCDVFFSVFLDLLSLVRN